MTASYALQTSNLIAATPKKGAAKRALFAMLSLPIRAWVPRPHLCRR